MEGQIVRWRGDKGIGFILGDDGIEYFFHSQQALTKRDKFHVTTHVSFDVIHDPNAEHLRAINVLKIGHGKKHPFVADLRTIAQLIERYVPDDVVEKKYRLRDIETIKNYLMSTRDVLKYDQVRKIFKPDEDNSKEDP